METQRALAYLWGCMDYERNNGHPAGPVYYMRLRIAVDAMLAWEKHPHSQADEAEARRAYDRFLNSPRLD